LGLIVLERRETCISNKKILEEDPANGLVFFKRLADILGNRLLHSYKMISAAAQSEASPSFGTGQVMATTVSELEM
jgi:hypothetical protein